MPTADESVQDDMVRDAPAVSCRGRLIDLGLGVAFGIAVLWVQPVSLMFRRPFWVDEAWVADLVKIPLSRQITLSSSTPVGWALLLRLVPGHAPERLRVVPLAFSAVAVVVAFALVRGLNWRAVGEARAAGVFAGAAVLLAPISLQQNDLKQYTADAALALLVLLIARDAEQRPERRLLVRLAVVSGVAVLFSSVVMFVAVAAFGGLIAAAALGRDWRRARDALVAGLCAGIVIAAYIGLVVVPHDNQALRHYWRLFYLHGSPGRLLSVAGHRFLALGPAFGVAPKFVFAFFVIGCAVLVARGNVAIAVAAVVLWLEMFTLGLVDRYPFLDVRTSHFLLIVTVVVATIGFSGTASMLARRRRVLLPSAAIIAVGALAFSVRDQVRTFRFPHEDLRVQTLYVAQHRHAGDVVVVNLSANWGFVYYWPSEGKRVFTARRSIAAGYVARVDGIDGVFAGGRGQVDVLATLKMALTERRALGGRGRLWIARTHVIGGEVNAWALAFAELRLHPVALTGGPEPLLAVDPASG